LLWVLTPRTAAPAQNLTEAAFRWSRWLTGETVGYAFVCFLVTVNDAILIFAAVASVCINRLSDAPHKGGSLSSERFLLCRPQGGLNDVLCNVEKTRLHADKFNRTLIVDTNFVNSYTTLGDFSDYFQTRANVILNASPLINKLRDLTTFPACVAGKLDSYRTYYDENLKYFRERTTRQKVSFKFDTDYEEQLLVHHGLGGGFLGVQALSWLQLNDVITAELIRRLSVINSPYCAIHIRNTDYRSDYLRRLN
jgi:hypothetical protein